MRELLFKNITSENKKRKDLYVSETVDRNGVTTTTQRHSIYILGGSRKFNTLEELLAWKKDAAEDVSAKRHVFIIKKHDTKLHKDMFVCDIVGRFYAVIGFNIHSIVFKHSFEVDFSYAGTPK